MTMMSATILPELTAATLMCLLCSSRTAATGLGKEPVLTDAAMARFADDLVLSEAQRIRLKEIQDSYSIEYQRLWDAYVQERHQYRLELCLSLRPELDESFDISQLSLSEQIRVHADRQGLKDGGIPPFETSVEQLLIRPLFI